MKNFIILLIVPLLFFNSCEEEETVGYNCSQISDTCVESADGFYLNLEDCENECLLTYSCNNGDCFAELGGQYTTLSDCLDVCIESYPKVDVNINLELNSPIFFNLEAIGGYQYINGGVGGILIYRKSIEEFIAYDRASPYNPTFDCRVEVQEDMIIIKDPCSESEYLIIDGSVLQGPANQALKRYTTILNGNQLSIFNEDFK